MNYKKVKIFGSFANPLKTPNSAYIVFVLHVCLATLDVAYFQTIISSMLKGEKKI